MNIAGLEPLSAAERLGVDLSKSEYDLVRQLVTVREAAGIKPVDLARQLGIDRSAVSRFESGGTNPTMATINRYAEAIGAMITYHVQPHHVWQSKKRDRDVVERTLTFFVDEYLKSSGPSASRHAAQAGPSHHGTHHIHWPVEVASAP